MFRLQENVPEVYVKQSRDFQLFCRIYDMINNAIRFNAKSTDTLLSPLQTSDKMLQLLATRVGFFPKSEYNTEALRQVISAFPYIIKYKGSKLGIEMALNTILKAENQYEKTIINFDVENSMINIYTKNRLQSEDLLRDVLSYILPVGYDLDISTYVEEDLSDSPSQLGINMPFNKTNNTVSIANKNVSIIINSDSNNSNDPTITDRAIGSYTTTLVLNDKNI